MSPEALAVQRVGRRRGGTSVVFRRELGAYFDSSIAYVYAAVFLLLSNGIFLNRFFLERALEMTEYFRVLPYLLVLFVPAITMRAWAEERAQGTLEIVLTLPYRASELVLGKFLAALTFLVLVLAGSGVLVVMLTSLGEPDIGTILSSYAGAVSLGATFLAIGLFASVGTRDQVIAFVIAAFACGLLVLLGHPSVVEIVDGLTPRWQLGTRIAETFSVMPSYERLTRGLVAPADLAWFVVVSVSFLWLNQRALAPARR